MKKRLVFPKITLIYFDVLVSGHITGWLYPKYKKLNLKGMLMKKALFVLTSSLFLSLSGSQLTPRGNVTVLTLAEKAQTNYTIIYAENAKSAALELRAYLKILSNGVVFPLASEKVPVKTPFISVGQTKFARDAGIGATLPERTATEIKVIGENIYLYANKDPFHAVMNFLEGDLGCRFYTDKISYLPAKNELKIAVASRCESAAFEDRLILTDYDLVLNDAWTRHNKVLKWEHFRHPRTWFAHTYNRVFSAQNFSRHPERFAVVQGKPSSTMICPTHPKNIEDFKIAIRKAMKQYPGKKYFSVSENDGGYPYCQCLRCKEIISSHGDAPIAPHLYLVNEVAKSVADRAPKQLVDFLVYTFPFRKLPVNLEMEPNVNLWFCCTGNRIIPEIKKYGREEELHSWRRRVKHMTVWDYSLVPDNYFQVEPNLYAKSQNLKFYKKYDIEGVMIQEPFGCRAGDQQRLRAWVFSKLLWNPELDVDELAREYCEGVYGAAAPERYAYYELVEKAGRAGQTIGDFYGIKQFVKEAGRLFETARLKLLNQSVALRELEMDYLPILITEINMIFNGYPANKKNFPMERYQYLLSEIKRISGQYKMSRYSETRFMSAFISELEMLQQLSTNDGIFEIHAVNGRLYDCPVVNDSLAVGGRVTRQFCDGSWGVQWPLPVNLFEPGRKYQLVAEMRVDKNSNSKDVCVGGIYNETLRKLFFLDKIDGSLLSNTEYRFIILGKPFLPGQGNKLYVFFNAPSTSDIGKLYVNRIRLIPVMEKTNDSRYTP